MGEQTKKEESDRYYRNIQLISKGLRKKPKKVSCDRCGRLFFYSELKRKRTGFEYRHFCNACYYK